ncbi:hypothetical protein Hanom_Chr14g01309781 [Helianthus anomalus]
MQTNQSSQTNGTNQSDNKPNADINNSTGSDSNSKTISNFQDTTNTQLKYTNYLYLSFSLEKHVFSSSFFASQPSPTAPLFDLTT